MTLTRAGLSLPDIRRLTLAQCTALLAAAARADNAVLYRAALAARMGGAEPKDWKRFAKALNG